MLIKILKPFSLQGKKYKVEDTLEIKDENKIPTEPFWFNRLHDKDIEATKEAELEIEAQKEAEVEIVEKAINKK